MSLDHIRRGLDRAVALQKKQAALSTSPAAKAPVAAPKVEEKPALTQAELDYWVDLLTRAQKPKLSTTDRLIRDRLNAMGLAPNDD